ncbi:MAG: hypothetical protein AAF721_01350 [Myxococcota bacterium]
MAIELPNRDVHVWRMGSGPVASWPHELHITASRDAYREISAAVEEGAQRFPEVTIRVGCRRPDRETLDAIAKALRGSSWAGRRHEWLGGLSIRCGDTTDAWSLRGSNAILPLDADGQRAFVEHCRRQAGNEIMHGSRLFESGLCFTPDFIGAE